MPYTIEPPDGSSGGYTIEPPDAPPKPKGSLAQSAADAVMTGERAIPFLSEATAGIGAPIEAAFKGESIPKAYGDIRRQQDTQVGRLKGEHPIVSNLTTGAGYMAPALAAIFSGGATEVPAAANAVRGVIPAAVKAATGGAGTAALYGASQPGSAHDRAARAASAVAPGAAIGLAVPAVGALAHGAVEHIAAPVVRTLIRGANAMGEGMGREAFLDAQKQAASRLREALHKDGVTPEQIESAVHEWTSAGAGSPKLHAIAGRNTMALLRAAAEKDEASNIAEQHAADVRGALSPSAQTRAAKLTPGENRTGAEYQTALKANQKSEAEAAYPAPYATPVQTTHEALAPLRTPEGAKALNKAISTARERAPHYEDSARELKELGGLKKYLADHAKYESDLAEFQNASKKSTAPLTATLKDGSVVPLSKSVLSQVTGKMPTANAPVEPKPPEMSGASLDRLRIKLSQRARSLFEKEPDKGGVVAKHAEAVDSMLNDIEGMPEARAGFKTRAEQLRAMNDVRSALTEPTETFAPKVAAMSKEAKESAQVRVRQMLQNAFGRKSRDVLGGLTSVAESPAIKANLTALYGPEEAEGFTKFAKLKLKEFKTSQQIAPSTGSQTHGRGVGEEGTGPLEGLRLLKGDVTAWLSKLGGAGKTMTRGERKALVQMGLKDEAPALLKKLYAKTAPKAGSSPPPYGRMTPALAAILGANASPQNQGQ